MTDNKKFKLELAMVLSNNGIDERLNIPDYILAKHLFNHLKNIEDMNNLNNLHQNLLPILEIMK
jgi:hypothetical protein